MSSSCYKYEGLWEEGRAGDFTEEVAFKGAGSFYLLEQQKEVAACHFLPIWGSMLQGYEIVGLAPGPWRQWWGQ